MYINYFLNINKNKLIIIKSLIKLIQHFISFIKFHFSTILILRNNFFYRLRFFTNFYYKIL